MNGELKLCGIRQSVRLGCDLEERRHAQIVTIDLSLNLKVDACIKSDELKDTADYAAVVGAVERFCREGEWKLVEKLAFDLGSELTTAFSQVLSVTVTVHKNVLCAAKGATITVPVTRETTN
jgi:dihydroneopterin aldolase